MAISDIDRVDIKFRFLLLSLIVMIVISLKVLYSLSYQDRSIDGESFLNRIEEIESSLDSIEFKRRVKKSEVIVVKEEVIKPVEVKVYLPKDSQKSVSKDRVSKKSVVNIESKRVNNTKKSVSQDRDIYNKYKSLKRSFYKKYDYKVALKLSKLYFDNGKYKDSLKWSMIANELNELDENSWILFAKSKIKLGDKKSAKKALDMYYKKYKSPRVKEILNKVDL
jgi:hypothetical protein